MRPSHQFPNLGKGSRPPARVTSWAMSQYRKARWQSLLSSFGYWFQGIDPHLPGVDPMQYGNSLLKWQYIGLQSVPLWAICGSETGTDEFDKSFRPLGKASKTLWLNTLIDLTINQNLQPVEVIKIVDGYFVQNGLYRISVAKYLGSKTYPAYVTEWELAIEQTNDEYQFDMAQASMPPPEAFIKSIYKRILQRVNPIPRKEVKSVQYHSYWADILIKMKF